jgi:hypothetical protein
MTKHLIQLAIGLVATAYALVVHRVVVVAFVILLGPGSAAVIAAPAAVPAVSDPRYFVGANVPWFNWGCDFGCADKGGASSPVVRAALADGFGRLKAAGVHTVRWWTLEGNPVQITRDASGSPTGLNPAVYTDFDAALALADQYDLVYDFVLFSAPTALPRAWITDPKQRQQLADALAPLFERYKDHPRILAWELINEPEWDMWNNKIPQAPVQATVKLLAETVHAHTSTAVTIGSATLEGVPLWVGQGLDFYSPHWYDSTMASGAACARCTDAASVSGLYHLQGSPVVLGEFYAGPDADPLQRFRDLRSKGFAGAWAWSLFSDKTNDKMHIDLSAVTNFTAATTTAPAVPVAEVAAAPAATKVQLLANWVSPTYASPGQSVTFHQDVQSASEMSMLLDFEVYDDSGNKVLQTTLDNQALSANGKVSFSTTVALPASLAAGRYTVKTGAFSVGWGNLYAWNDAAGAFVVDKSPVLIPASGSDAGAPMPATPAPEPENGETGAVEPE